MARYRISATLMVDVTQHGQGVRAARDHERALAAALTQAVNDVLTKDTSVRELLWAAAGAGDNFEGELNFVVNNVVKD